MSFMEIKRFVNSGNTPLNTVIKDEVGGMGSDAKSAKHAIWLNDYKTYGTDSFVYNNKDILYELYLSDIAIFDKSISTDALAYADSVGKVGKLLSGITSEMENIDTVNTLLLDSDLLPLVFSNDYLYKCIMPYIITNQSLMKTAESSSCFISSMSSKMKTIYFNGSSGTGSISSYEYLYRSSALTNVFVLRVETSRTYYSSNGSYTCYSNAIVGSFFTDTASNLPSTEVLSGQTSQYALAAETKDVNRFMSKIYSEPMSSSYGCVAPGYIKYVEL